MAAFPVEAEPREQSLRSGTAARLAGLPVTTLRVWERRYGVVAAEKSAGGQRIYSMRDVARLKRLRELTESGHAIGRIASLDLPSLEALLTTRDHARQRSEPVAFEMVAVGHAAAHLPTTLRGCSVIASFEGLDEAEDAAPRIPKGAYLYLRFASLQPSLVDRVLDLSNTLQAKATLVAFGFGARPSLRSLHNAGVAVRREPLASEDLEQWVRSVDNPLGSVASASIGREAVAARIFTDEDLAALATMPSAVACECLRHMSDIISQLAGFERYSRDCVSVGPADAALHRHLCHVAGSARSMFELALQRAIDERGVELGSAGRA